MTMIEKMNIILKALRNIKKEEWNPDNKFHPKVFSIKIHGYKVKLRPRSLILDGDSLPLSENNLKAVSDLYKDLYDHFSAEVPVHREERLAYFLYALDSNGYIETDKGDEIRKELHEIMSGWSK